MEYIAYYLVAASLFAAIDLIWLGVIAKNFYRSQLGTLFTDKVVKTPAILFYSLYIGGLCYFGLRPAIDASSAFVALYSGGLFGLLAYATYDLTNWATLKNWPSKLSVIDVLWGTLLTGLVTMFTYFIAVKVL